MELIGARTNFFKSGTCKDSSAILFCCYMVWINGVKERTHKERVSRQQSKLYNNIDRNIESEVRIAGIYNVTYFEREVVFREYAIYLPLQYNN